MIDFYEMTLDSADAILAEARAFLDAPIPPSSARWEQVLALEWWGSYNLSEEGEKQKYAERVRPYIIDKLDHGWPGHLRAFKFNEDPFDENSWMLGRTLQFEHIWRKEIFRHVPKGFFQHPRFAHYTGLVLGGLVDDQLEPFIDLLTEHNFKELTSLAIEFDSNSFLDGKHGAPYTASAKLLIDRWKDSLEHLQIAYPSYCEQKSFGSELFDTLTSSLVNMPALRSLEISGFWPEREQALTQLLEAISASSITKLGLRDIDSDMFLELERLVEENLSLFKKIEVLLLDQIPDEQFALLLRADALAHVEKRFFKEVEAEDWEDASYHLLANIELANSDKNELDKETLGAREMTLDGWGNFDVNAMRALLKDPENPRVFGQLERLDAYGLDEDTVSLFLKSAPTAFPALKELDFNPEAGAIKLLKVPAQWPTLTKLVINCESATLDKFTGPRSFPSLTSLTLTRAREDSWTFLFAHPEYFPSLQHLDISAASSRDDWYDFFTRLRQSPLLDQLQTSSMIFSSPTFNTRRVLPWIHGALDPNVPLAIRRYMYRHIMYAKQSGRQLEQALLALGEPVAKGSKKSALQEQLDALFPPELKLEDESDDTIDLSKITRFELANPA